MPNKRTLDKETVSRMRAHAVVRPIIDKIGVMVDRAVFLETLAAIGRTRSPTLRLEAAELADGARTELKSFDERLSELPAEVVLHTRVTDARRALLAVADRFERTRSSL